MKFSERVLECCFEKPNHLKSLVASHVDRDPARLVLCIACELLAPLKSPKRKLKPKFGIACPSGMLHLWTSFAQPYDVFMPQCTFKPNAL